MADYRFSIFVVVVIVLAVFSIISNLYELIFRCVSHLKVDTSFYKKKQKLIFIFWITSALMVFSLILLLALIENIKQSFY